MNQSNYEGEAILITRIHRILSNYFILPDDPRMIDFSRKVEVGWNHRSKLNEIKLRKLGSP